MNSVDKAAFEKKAFKFVPYLILGKIIFAAKGRKNKLRKSVEAFTLIQTLA